ncbi:hypothetical protein [Paraburkholderia sp. BR14374]
MSYEKLANRNGMQQRERGLGGALDKSEALNEHTPGSAGDGKRRRQE